MSEFRRRFFEYDWKEYPVVQTLLDHWRLPGEKSENKGLRLAVRNGYLNLYRKGQSVGKLYASSRRVKLEVHREYSAGRTKPGRIGEKLSGYQCFDDSWLRDANNCSRVAGWIATADTYAGAEKTFVDDLVAANPGVIDIEMGLPAYEGERSAPRMDLVVVEPSNSLAFWEVKCADNPEIRAHGEPHVVAQVNTYETWMAKEGRQVDVVRAYRDAAVIMLGLAAAAGKPDGTAQACWRGLRDAEDPRAIARPGIALGGYRPHGSEKDIPSRWRSFEKNGHRSRLQCEYGLTLAVFVTAEDVSANPLPRLAGDLR